MYNVKLLNKIAKCGTSIFDAATYTVGEEVTNAEAIMVRSASMHEMEFDKELTITPASHVTVKVDGVAVEASEITYSEKVLSISLANMNLQKNSILDVEIKSDVLVAGEKLDRNMSRRFYVGDNDGFYVGGTDVEINGNVVSALVDYINSTGEEKPLYLLPEKEL